MTKITKTTFDRFYNGQEIQEMLGERAIAEKNIGYNCALYGMNWVKARSEYPLEWHKYAGYFLQAEKYIEEGLLFFKKDGYTVKVMKDGNAFCCVGEGFINLQESENYAFGETFEAAICCYKQKFIK